MQPLPIIWDFDGTILPLTPYDSEQTLLMHRLDAAPKRAHPLRRLAVRAVVYGDMKEWFSFSFRAFKHCYIWAAKGLGTGDLDRVAARLAERIPPDDRHLYRRLAAKGHPMLIVSCGTADLSERVLALAGIDGCFRAVCGNRFRFKNGRIAGMDLTVLTPADKPAAAAALGFAPEQAVAVGDGYSDLPLLDRSPVPVLVDRSGSKRGKFTDKGYRRIASVQDLEPMLAALPSTGRTGMRTMGVADR